tara:strand:- start:1190 stop:1828 length:639 start_codon:yes stop_codon:yes gene_type:complete
MELKVNVPTRMQDITLEQYQKFLKECTDEDLSEEFIAIKMLEIFCGLPEDHSLQLKMSDVFEICEKINLALNEKPNLIARWKYDQIEFGFIPQLDDMTFGEYVDVDTYITDWETMHRAMAVLYRPVLQNYKGSYEIEEYKGDTYWELMKRMPLNLVMGCMLFFWTLERDLVSVMRNSLKNPKTQTYHEKLTSMLNMDGIIHSGDLQTKTSQK